MPDREKELSELEGCLCEQTEDTEVILNNKDYTSIGARKDKYGLVLFAWGEGETEYKPDYCPFCGKAVK